jgi:integrase
VALRIERRGERLGLRGPLPGRGEATGFTMQRISLGLPASEAGLAEAGRQLRQVLAELQRQQFDWQRWGRPSRPAANGGPDPGAARPCSGLEQQLERFEAAFFADPARRRNPAGSRTTWTAAYRPYLRRLVRTASTGDAQRATPTLLDQVLESYPLGSRSRQQCGTALAALAQHLELPLPADWRQRATGYGLHRAQFRQLPSDGQILQLLEQIPNPAWRLAYGLMATYGLRNHEVFFCDLSALAPGGDRVIRVLPTSKTGEHQVWPFQPEWVEQFGLERLGRDPRLLPPVRTDLSRTTLQQVGRRVAEQFRRYALPITPYDLRHAWAVRTIHIGLPDTVAARMMGHSVTIHTRTYHHWITRRDQQQAVDAALARQRAA